MKSLPAAKQLRRELDENLILWKKIPKQVPKRGWIHNIREGLGMSTHQLAARLRMSQSGVVTLEKSEAKQTIQLSTLKKVARSLGCELVYALVPQLDTVEKLLENRKLIVAEHGLHPILRKTKLTAAEKRELVAEHAKRLKPKKIWEKLDYKEYEEIFKKMFSKAG